MLIAEQLAEIKQARARGESWLALARRMRTLEDQGAWRSEYATRLDWLHALHEATGYAPSTLRSFLEGLEFLERLAASHQGLNILEAFSDPDTKVAGIAAVPVLKLIHDMSPERLDEILPRVLKGDMKVRDLRLFYETQVLAKAGAAVKPSKLALRVSGNFTTRALDALEASLPALTGSKNLRLVRKHYRFELFRPDAVALSINDTVVEFADAFEVRQVASLPHPALRSRIVAEVMLAARFFRHHWLILPEGSRLTDYVIESLETAGEDSVGIAEVTSAGKLVVKSRPKPKPAPKKQAVALQEIFHQGVPRSTTHRPSREAA